MQGSVDRVVKLSYPDHDVYNPKLVGTRVQQNTINRVVLPFCHARPKAARGSPTENGPQRF